MYLRVGKLLYTYRYKANNGTGMAGFAQWEFQVDFGRIFYVCTELSQYRARA